MQFVFEELAEFKKEFKKLSKKYGSLYEDFKVLKSFLKISPTGIILPKGHIERIADLGKGVNGEFYKVKKFRCQSLSKNSQNSGIRIIYRFEESTGKIEFTMIEIYQKSKKSNHDIERIKTNF